MDGLGHNLLALSVLYTFPLRWCVVQNKIGGPFMNIEQYQNQINNILEQLEQDMPKAKRLELVANLRELLSAFFVD